ncbi:glycoside hydrolase family 97 N-terminal domain-containing protein [Streptomyces fuscichromogenes]|uniref:glycoside hydrolase family 97 N-terminal domain-containing protein n=1 Tax=Streptomyces fuscichromogenes TaxID=1324013 RepID=UPI0038283AE1
MKRSGKTVLDSSVLGPTLSNGPSLGTGNVSVTNYRHWAKDSAWTPVLGRTRRSGTTTRGCAGTSGTAPSGTGFSVRLRAYNTGVALRYVLLDTGSATTSDEPTNWAETAAEYELPIDMAVAAPLGEYVAVARGSGTSYTATVCADGTAGSTPHATSTVVSTQTVTASTTFSVAMSSAGGL